MKTCFGCLTLRQGCYLSAAFSIVISVLGIGVTSYAMIVARQLLEKEADKLVAQGKLEEYERQTAIDAAWGIASIIVIVTLVIYAIWLLAGLALAIGTYKKSKGAMTFWMVCAGFMVGLQAIGTVLSVIQAQRTFATAQSTGEFVVGVICLVFTFYAMMGVSAYKKELLAEESGQIGNQHQLGNPPPYMMHAHENAALEKV